MLNTPERLLHPTEPRSQPAGGIIHSGHAYISSPVCVKATCNLEVVERRWIRAMPVLVCAFTASSNVPLPTSWMCVAETLPHFCKEQSWLRIRRSLATLQLRHGGRAVIRKGPGLIHHLRAGGCVPAGRQTAVPRLADRLDITPRASNGMSSSRERLGLFSASPRAVSAAVRSLHVIPSSP